MAFYCKPIFFSVSIFYSISRLEIFQIEIMNDNYYADDDDEEDCFYEEQI